MEKMKVVITCGSDDPQYLTLTADQYKFLKYFDNQGYLNDEIFYEIFSDEFFHEITEENS
jgi:hypothetical protein